MKPPIPWAAALLAGLLVAPAFAGSATVEAGSGKDRQQVRFEYQNEQLRMQPEAQAEGTMILRDGRLYVIANDMVFEFASMAKMMGSLGGQVPLSGPADLSRYLGLEATGRTETIAGASGKVHVLRYADAQGREQREEIVLSGDARARELAGAMQSLSQTLMRALGKTGTPGEAQLQAQIRNQGVLRYGQEFRVLSFGGEPAADRFELPAAPQSMPSLGALGGAQGAFDTSGEAADDGGDGVFGRLFGDKAHRQQERIEQRGEAEVDQATDEAVDSVLDKAFDKLFNR
jgi:hypothetical protein